MAEKNWFIFRGDHHLGPFTFDDILEKVKLSQIDSASLTWFEGANDWLPVGEQPEILHALAEEEHLKEIKLQEEQKQRAAQKENQERIERIKIQERQRLESLREKEAYEEERYKDISSLPPVPKVSSEAEAFPPPELPSVVPFDNLPAIPLEGKESKVPQSLEDGEVSLPELPLTSPEVKKEGPQEEKLDQITKVDLHENKEENISYKENENQGTESLDEEYYAEYEEHEFNGPQMENILDFKKTGLQDGITKSELIENDGEGFPDLQEDPSTEDNTFFEDVERDIEIFEPENDAPEASLKVYSGMILSFIGFMVLLVMYFKTVSSERKFYNIARDDKDSLQGVMNQPFLGKAEHRLRLSRDYNSLWFGTNIDEELTLFISLKGIRGRIINENLPKLESRAFLRGKAAHFVNLQVVEGESLAHGEYEYLIKGVSSGTFSKLRKTKKKIEFSGKIIIAPYPKEEFEKKLAHFQTRIERKVLRPYRKQLEYYKTFKALLSQLGDMYRKSLAKIRRGKSISLFERKYNEQLGPMLTDIILDNNRNHIALINLKPKESKAFEDSMIYGKAIGNIVSSMVVDTKRYKKLTKKRKKTLIKRFNREIAELEKVGDARIDYLEKEIKNAQIRSKK